MIKIGDLTLDFSNPLVIMGAIGVFLFMMLLLNTKIEEPI